MQNKKIDEVLDEEGLQKEYIMLGLRKLAGFNIYDFIKKFRINPLKTYNKNFEKLFKQNLLEIDYSNMNIKLTHKGLDSMGRICIVFNNKKIIDLSPKNKVSKENLQLSKILNYNLKLVIFTKKSN